MLARYNIPESLKRHLGSLENFIKNKKEPWEKADRSLRIESAEKKAFTKPAGQYCTLISNTFLEEK
ncbi:hypothetical protein [Terrimonas pollutisoli]|uniref:hypothetical protein n=1 Tax=Terrimonas pollutisoli TaxID=3034147 RepID=UPI0023ECBDB9|nr:hypothetical protein [Terrimonas sp. H1YJ31]